LNIAESDGQSLSGLLDAYGVFLLKPFLDFYKQHNISPVHQDITDLRRHFERREALYRLLGIAPGLVEGKSVIEFGPGSGHNAIYTTSLEPRRYVLVDGNETGLKETQGRLSAFSGGATKHEIVESDIENFESDEKFDIVLCEGVIPFQLDPPGFVKHVGKFVKPGGLFILTCIDGVSFLGESTRRLIASSIVPFSEDPKKKLEILRPVFAPHLETLQGMSRPLDDWLYDNIFVPYSGKLFSIKDAITALYDDFDIYGTSPDFIQDWRWYKSIYGNDRLYNEHGMELYLSNVASFVDYRITLPAQTTASGETFLKLAEDAFYIMAEMENSGDYSKMEMVIDTLVEITKNIAPLSKITAESLEEVTNYLFAPQGKNPASYFEKFSPFFGRGQQYVSFIKK